MGGGNSKSTNIFQNAYQKERLELRKALILSFIDNPENKDILSKISAVRSIVVQHADICLTGARELENKFEYSPTSIDAAYNELERLFTIYETSSILKSVQCRIGPVACPLGHYAPYFDNLTSQCSSSSSNKKKDNPNVCGICTKVVKSGHQCSYCNYNLCVPCSTVYCCNGHAMKLWTHPEAQHKCVVCSVEPITSGYRCTVCEDYDICDYCTHTAGRKAVQQVILDRMTEDLLYMENHVDESETAMRTFNTHQRKMATNSYPTTLQLYEFSLTLNDLRTIAVAEVRQTRITREVQRLRDILSVGKDLSATAMRESLRDGFFTVEEIDRLTLLLAVSDRERSPQVRRNHIVACPLGHAAVHFMDRPAQYLKRDSLVARKGTKAVATCSICERVADEGYHCDFCEYDLCTTCAVVFCTKGHPMKLWTEPEAVVTCGQCKSHPICSGYHCNVCNSDMCDMCTAKAGRGTVRNVWESEMHELLAFMKANKRLSDIASYYHWRHKNYIVSIGLLCEYVKELRTAKARAEKQVEQKPIIDKIKELRLLVTADVNLCATAATEAARGQEYIFATKRKAAAEAGRLKDLLDLSEQLRTPQHRSKCGIACPLGHGAKLIDDSELLPITQNNSEKSLPPPPVATENDEHLQLDSSMVASTGHHHQSFPSSPLRIANTTPLGPNITVDALQDTDIDVNLHTYNDDFFAAADQLQLTAGQTQTRACRVCCTLDLTNGGHSCSYCAYDLCRDCSVVYCRQSHPLRIWTMPDAVSLSCDLCKKSPITSGYRCLECQVDICDLCTTQDCRNAFMFWPRREIMKVLNEFETLKADSSVITNYLAQQNSIKVDKCESMSKLSLKLKELADVKKLMAEEMQLKKSRAEAKRYGMYAYDM